MELEGKKIEAAECGGLQLQDNTTKKRWQDLPEELLPNIFKNLNVWELLFEVPLVCRSWSSAAMDPTCWRVLDMRLYAHSDYDYILQPDTRDIFRGRFLQVLKIAVDRAGRSILHLIFSTNLTHLSDQDLIYISQRTPRLKRLVLPWCEHLTKASLRNWSEVEAITAWLGGSMISNNRYLKFIRQIGIHCKKLKELKVFAEIRERDALVIARSIPKLEILDISMAYLSDQGLSTLLDHCTELKYLNISHCHKVEERRSILGSKYRDKIKFDPGVIERAAYLIDEFHHCPQEIQEYSCDVCKFARSPLLGIYLDIWLWGRLCFLCGSQLSCESWLFVPYYILAVQTGQEERFHRYFDAWQASKLSNHLPVKMNNVCCSIL